MATKFKPLQFFDLLLIIPVVLLVTIGCFFIYSSGVNSDGISVSREYIKQMSFGVAGVIIMLLVALLDYRAFQRHAWKLFLGLAGLLVYTRLFGRKVNGAVSWIGIGGFGIQPSEFGKIIFILYLADFLERSGKMGDYERFIKALCILAVPCGLILLQPDLGSASVYIPVFLAMCYVAGVPVRFIMLCLCTGMLTIVVTMFPTWATAIAQKNLALTTILVNMKLRLIVIAAMTLATILSFTGYRIFRNKYYFWACYVFGIITASLVLSIGAGKVLKDYQIKRLIVFLDPQTDPLGSGWNIIQSKIAIGSGNLWGQGYLNGTQSHLRFLPQQSTDFIFSILAEEWGFAGGLAVFILYLAILLRILMILRVTTNTYGYFIATGVLFMLFFHFIVNVGMVMGIMPITGIPLVFLSYGGSSLWTAMICVGLVMSINYRRLDFTQR
ncbi:MAG: rod shape-determining protein RodA [Treponemataceae bacterium]|nr:rod shape-determining protein RodA [Treponemataceae bacterium]